MSPKDLMRTVLQTLEGLRGEPTVVICGASACLVLAHYHGSVGYFQSTFGSTVSGHPAAGAAGHLYWFGTSVLFYGLLPLALSVATRGSFHRRYGFGLGDWRAGVSMSALFLSVMIPAVYIASKWSAFRGAYPLAGSAAYTLVHDGKPAPSWGMFAVYEAAYLTYFVAWEFLFRGWLVNGLLPHWGRTAAILTQVLPFALMHLGKAEPETLGSIVAGVALGVLAVRTGSFWYGAAIHGLIAVWMDWLSARVGLAGP